ncbi:MAG: FimV/HubP family polar landmark protein [Methylococcales bacterium]
MRNFSKTLTLMGLLAPVGANALGVGEIKLHSALNQVLEAEIPLITSSAESSSDIRVSLASPTAFVNAGIERPYYLSRLRFTPVVKNGRIVVKISSKDVIREPFLNFLIEVNWPTGRMLREFTVLLDPPATFNDSTITATRAPTVQSSTVTKPHYPIDQPANYGFRSRPPAAAKSKAAKKHQPGDFITSKRNDSLWALTNRVDTEPPVSKEQLMVALYEANPHAFFKENMNALKAGQRLKVPSREVILKTSRPEALAELERQNDQWSGKAASVAGKNPPETVAKIKEVAAKLASDEPESKLKLVSPALGETVAKSSSDTTRSAPPAGKTDLAVEMVETIRQENDELRSRLKEIEAQLARMQLMLTLKDKQLGALQSQPAASANPTGKIIDLEADKASTESPKPETELAGSAENTVASVEATPKTQVPFTVISEQEPGTPTDPTQSGKVVDQPVATNQQPKPVSTDQNPVNNEHPVDEAVSEVQPALALQPALTETAPKPVESRPVQTVPAEPSESAVVNPARDDDFVNELLSEPYYLAAGGVALVLLGLLGLALARRRSRIIMAETESILSSPHGDRETVTENTGLKNIQPVQNNAAGVVESSFLSEFTPSDFDALETDHDDVDPVSEADVYLAYGRYQQAEDLIRSAIEHYPERDECKLKLLEIHFATEDRDAFETYARELEAFKKGKPEFWAKVAEMGREICPNSALFGAGVRVEQSKSRDAFGSPDFNQLNSDTFDLSDTGFRTGESDFEGDDLGFEVTDNFDESDEYADFGSDSGPDNVRGSIAFSEESTDDGNSIEFDRFHKGAGLDIGRGWDHSGTLPANELDVDHETIEFVNMDLGDSSSTLYRTASDEASELSDLTDGDEIETKLDLAKAYVDLDDQESARGILSQILIEGNDEQKNEARALVDVLENKA